MSVDIHPAPAPADGAPKPRGDWSGTWHGVRTVATLELRQRVRSTRWKVALLVWFVVVGGITLLTSGAAGYLTSSSFDEHPQLGPVVFGLVVFFVLFLGLLVAPTLSAASINGDRNAGTLATLQVTLLTAAEIVVGKLLAAWTAALAFLVASIPFIAWSLVLGGVPLSSLVVTLLLLAILLAVVCAIGLGFSALVSKTSGSAVLSYLTVGGLTIISLLVFGLTTPLVTTWEEVPVLTLPYGYDSMDGIPEEDCEWETREMSRTHTERTWWLLAINPFVIVADAAPPAGEDALRAGSVDPLAVIRVGVRTARTGPPATVDWCTWEDDYGMADEDLDDAPVWPWGLAVNVLLGAGGVVVAVRRLRIPTDRLARGTRVA